LNNEIKRKKSTNKTNIKKNPTYSGDEIKKIKIMGTIIKLKTN